MSSDPTAEAPADHPLVELYRLAGADTSLALELIVDHGGKLVRLRSRPGNLWVMRAREDGSIYDRWSESEGKVLVKLTEEQIAEGPRAMWKRLLDVAGLRGAGVVEGER